MYDTLTQKHMTFAMERGGDVTDRSGRVHTETEREGLCEEMAVLPIFKKVAQIRAATRWRVSAVIGGT